MVTEKLLVRAVSFRYVRVVGATPQDISRAFHYIKKTWGNKAVTLKFSTHSENKEWYHITFNTQNMNSAEIKNRATQIRDDLKRFFQGNA